MSFRTATLFTKLIRSKAGINVTSRREYGISWMFKWFGQDTLIWLQQPLDLTVKGLMIRVTKKNWKILKESQKLNLKEVESLGSELAASKFIMENGGSVKFTGASTWFRKKENGSVVLPAITPVKVTLEAIDASNTNLMYDSFENFDNLENIRSLNLSNCKYIDDWCLDHLSIFRSSLTVLNLSRCSRVTENGLACLHRFKKLRRLVLNDMQGVKNSQLTYMMLEEVLPECFIEGDNYNIQDTLPDKTEHNKHHNIPKISKTFIDNWEKQALSEDKEQIAVSLKLNANSKL